MTKQRDYGTVRDYNGKPSTPSPLPSRVPFSIEAGPSRGPDLREALTRIIEGVHDEEAHQFDSGAESFRDCPEWTCQEAVAAFDKDSGR